MTPTFAINSDSKICANIARRIATTVGSNIVKIYTSVGGDFSSSRTVLGDSVSFELRSDNILYIKSDMGGRSTPSAVDDRPLTPR